MEVDPVGRVPEPRSPLRVVGGTAELADARTRLREATPDGRWDAVLAEVGRLQFDHGMTPLAALRAVHARLASGWIPPTR